MRKLNPIVALILALLVCIIVIILLSIKSCKKEVTVTPEVKQRIIDTVIIRENNAKPIIDSLQKEVVIHIAKEQAIRIQLAKTQRDLAIAKINKDVVVIPENYPEENDHTEGDYATVLERDDSLCHLLVDELSNHIETMSESQTVKDSLYSDLRRSFDRLSNFDTQMTNLNLSLLKKETRRKKFWKTLTPIAAIAGVIIGTQIK